MSRPVVVQHSWGVVGGGGPIGALNRLMESPVTESYEFVPMHAENPHGGVDVSTLRRWGRWLKEIQPDLVHVRGLGNEGFHGVIAARLAGCPRILVSIHGTQRDLSGPASVRRRIVTNGLEPLTLQLATHITTVCEYAAQRPFVQRHREKLVGPIVNGITLPRAESSTRAAVRTEWHATEADVVLISVGRLSWDKGHADLAEALGTLRQHVRARVVLVVVGDGPDAREIERAYDIAGLRARMLGRRSDVPELLAGADVFAFPSWHENLSNALIEAMASGVPAVATSVGGNTEVVRRGGGVLVAARDPDALAGEISRLVENSRLRHALGREAFEVARKHYSTDAMAASVDRVYRQVLGWGR